MSEVRIYTVANIGKYILPYYTLIYTVLYLIATEKIIRARRNKFEYWRIECLLAKTIEELFIERGTVYNGDIEYWM